MNSSICKQHMHGLYKTFSLKKKKKFGVFKALVWYSDTRSKTVGGKNDI